MKVPVSTYPGRTLVHQGKTFYYFGGTSYLGLQQDPEFRELAVEAIRQFGSSYGASRRANVHFTIYEEAEEKIAQWVGSEAALTLSSGYLAGQMVANHFKNKEHKLFYAPNSHSALYTSGAKPYTTYTTLGIALRQHLEKKQAEIPVIFLDSIDFSGCNYPEFEILKTLPLESCILVVDDSHGIGVVGESGSGVHRTLTSLPCKEIVLCASMGKALSVQAGMVAGKTSRIEKMKASDFFGGASPPAPFYMAQFLKAGPIYENRRKVLQRHITYFHSVVRNQKLLNYMPDYPVFGYSNPDLTAYLRERFILVTDFRYPTEDTYATSRIVLTSAHQKDDLTTLAEILNSFGGKAR
ncbi:aminotransferase class I/II-fold pyridoxal phosphate-dependent enzyme [Muriicola sp.]|uniref:aminotransferase class I/II-fold pyridoxal phosphate-dependent enzyme n=1 Tax=Muriicola sp. TaxID=2020856 RepID=UPI003568DD67